MSHSVGKLMFLILMFFVVFGMLPGRIHAWYRCSSKLDSMPVFGDVENKEMPSNEYFFFPNRPDEVDSFLERASSGRACIAKVNINIAFDTLTKTVINTESFLDRQIAANLKLQNLLFQYLNMRKRNAEALKHLNIPYLDNGDQNKRRAAILANEDIVTANRMKKKMADILFFQKDGRARLPVQERPEFQSVWAGDNKDNAADVRQDNASSFFQEQASFQEAGDVSGRHPETYGRVEKVPWIFVTVLKLLRYVVSNKFAILGWASATAAVCFIGIWLVKR